MDKVKAMQAFVRIVEANSFTKAAETLNLPRAALTATLKNLEAYLGTRLLQRTTRRLSLTPDGAQYYRHCLDILAAIDTAELSFRGPDARKPKGRLRVDLPGALGRNVILPRIGEFRAAYPEVEFTISVSDKLVDLTQEGVDCALRVGALQDSALVGRRLGTMRFMICAAPSYIAQHGLPRKAAELAAHCGVVHFSGRTGRAFDWELETPRGSIKVAVSGPVAVNDADANLCCALQGLGLAQLGRYQARPWLDSGQLREVLPGVAPTSMPISLLYPQGRMAAPRLSAFADWLAALFAADEDLRL